MAEFEGRSLLQEMGLDNEEIARRKEFLELRETDIERLRGLHQLAAQYANSVIQEFYDHLLAFEEGRAFFKDPAVLERVKIAQKNYFLELTEGTYDQDYIQGRLKIGLAHERINLPVKLYLGMYNFYLRAIAKRFLAARKDNAKKAFDDFISLLKIVFLDLGLAIETYLHQREATIVMQQEAIRELSARHLRDALEQRANKEIQKERDFAHKLIETAQVIILVLDKEGHVIQYNPFMEKLSGYRLEEMHGKDWFSRFLPERDRSRIRQLFLRVLSERDTGGINPILAQDGTERLIEWSCTTLKDSFGATEGLLCIGQDITEKTRLQEQLIEKERLAAMSVTAAKLVHEIGNPLNGMSLTAELLRIRVDAMKDPDSAIKSGLDRLIRETTRLNQLIREFKSFFASERHVFRPVSLATVAAETLEVEKTSYAGRNVKVEQTLPEDLPLIVGDADKLKQAVLNLCKNAVDAMPDGGILSVRGFTSGDHVILEIADTGVGIPPGVDVLTPFTTTKVSGSGLGIMIVRQIVSIHGGALTYTSEPDKGTVFRLSFPALQSAKPIQ